MKRTGVYLFFLFSHIFVFSQLPAQDEVRILLRYENNYYIKLHTQGWGFGYRTGYNMTALKKRMFDFSFFTMKHPKEVRISNTLSDFSAKSYIYGKVNSFFLVQASIGTLRVLNEKPYWSGIELRTFVSAGPVLGFTKPVYLYIFPDKSLQKYDPEKHFYDNIYGRGPFLKGFDDIKLHPGLFVKAGFNFEHGADDSRIRALEAGAMICAFIKPVEIMSYTENSSVFATLYLCYQFGNRKN